MLISGCNLATVALRNIKSCFISTGFSMTNQNLQDDVALLVRFWGYNYGEAKSRFTIRWLFGRT